MEGQIVIQGPGSSTITKTVYLVGKSKDLETLSSPLAWKILEELKRQPDFPGSLARRLKVHEQKIYYHIRRMSSAGLLKVVKEEQRRGGLCKFYAPVAEAFGIQLHGKGKPVPGGLNLAPARLQDFLQDFSQNGSLDAMVVVGSPYSHGPFLTVARDSPYAVQLGLRLGQMFAPPKGQAVRLDTEVKAEGLEKSNMILVGGPVANIISLEVNERLNVKFEWKDVWRIISKTTGRIYTEDQCGLIAKVMNPWKEDSKLLLLWGLHYSGTLSAILALTQYSEKVLNEVREGEDFYRVVLGLDRDGDGKMDDIEVLE